MAFAIVSFQQFQSFQVLQVSQHHTLRITDLKSQRITITATEFTDLSNSFQVFIARCLFRNVLAAYTRLGCV